jgi:hypothetical protein
LNMSKVSDTSANPNSKPSKILRCITFEKGFHFFTNSGNYTGITAISLSEFAEKIKIVSARSVQYHFRRRDFQRWVNDVIGDVELANRIARLDTELSSENLRKELLKIVRKRIREVEKNYGNAV